MKWKMFVILALVALIGALGCGAALADTSGPCGDNVNYSFNSTTGVLTITGTGPMTEFSSANPSPFKGNTAISSVIIGEGVTSVGYDAFNGCTGVTSVSLPSTLQSIGAWAFYRCSMSEINLPSGLTNIGGAAFNTCANLQSVVIPGGVTAINGSTFMQCSKLASITIPDSVTNIGSNAFQNCVRLNNVTIPTHVESIGNNAFYNCNSMSSISIPVSVRSIGTYAFDLCGSLNHAYIYAPFPTIADYAFTQNSPNLVIHALYGSLAEVYAEENEISFENLSFTVTFDANGGTGIISPITLTHVAYSLPECSFIAPSGKIFSKWNKGNPGTNITISGNITLQAQWVNASTVSFNANGGSGTMESVLIATGGRYHLPDCLFNEPEGMVFAGWNLGQPNDWITVSENVILTAQWEEYTSGYRIRVRDGYAKDNNGTIIKSAPLGATVYVYSYIQQGYYVSSWSRDDGGTGSYINDFSSSYYRFTMPARDVTITPVKAKQTPYEIDLNEGYTDSFSNMILYAICQSAGNGHYNYNTPTYKANIDIDGDGTFDIRANYPPSGNRDIRPLSSYSLGSHYSMSGPNYTPYYPIYFKLNFREYNVTAVGGHFLNGSTTISATPGSSVTVYNDKHDGSYVESWSRNDDGEGNYYGDYDSHYFVFTMPARDVTVMPSVMTEQTPFEIDLTEGYKRIDNKNIIYAICQSAGAGNYDSTTYSNIYRIIADIDGNGENDIRIDYANASDMRITPLSTYSAGSGYTMNDLNCTKYYPISFITTSFTITFDANGHGTAPANQYVLEDQFAREPEAPTDEDYTFVGWYTEPECVNAFDFATTTIRKSITLYAKWTLTPVTVSFDHGEGTGTMEPVTVAKGSDYVLPECTFTPPAGQEFWRWSTSQGNKKPGESITANYETTVTARYRSDYNVNFERNYAGHFASGTQAPITVPVGQKLMLPECNLEVPSGTMFDHWEVSDGYGTGLPGDQIQIHDDVWLYLRWVNAYQVYFNKQGHGTETPNTQRVKEGHTAELPTLTASLYTFLGWYTEPECENAFDPETPITEDVYLYAKWAAKPLITYYFNYPNSENTGSDYIDYGATVPENNAADPRYPSLYKPYEFEGWFADEALTMPFDFTAPVYADTNLYGKWHLPSYTATFDLNGGTGSVPCQTVEAGSLVTEPELVPSRIGYSFAGWYYMNGSLETKWQFLVNALDKDTTIFAKWVEPPMDKCLRLPAALNTIEAYAFYEDRSYTAVIVPKNVTSIGTGALGCFSIGSVLYIYDGNLFICGYPGSAAEDYATAHNMPFVPIDDAWLVSH